MIVSLEWLADYVDLPMGHDALVDRLTMSGLNHEGTEDVGDDRAIDLEVTSNRPDCLGHIGVAREVAVLYGTPLTIPQPELTTASESITKHVAVEIQSPESCYRYTGRLIRGVKIGPSPKWLQDRLTTLGIGIVNNVVDATNYVMFESGQPLHAFDYSKLAGRKVVVRNAKAGEKFEAIDHKVYELDAETCVVADETRAIAIGGVMGGAYSEVNDETTDVLIEAAWFDQLSVRKTARKLNLHSPSSFRFERNIDAEQLDWASQRCCELILASAGGELLDGMVDEGAPPKTLEFVTLNLAQLKRILGIEIPAEFVPTTLIGLGMEITNINEKSITVVPPSWRKDLTREIDLVEEVGRIYGFDKVPDNAAVPMAASTRPANDRVLDRVRQILLFASFDEAITPSLVPEKWSSAFSPWSDLPPLTSSQPMLGVLEKSSHNIGAVDLMRRSLVPSLVEARRINEYRSNSDIELFETAKVYLTDPKGGIPVQPTKLALISGHDYYYVKGVLESVVGTLAAGTRITVKPCAEQLLDISQSGQLFIGDVCLGWLGEISKAGRKLFGLRSRACVAEIDMAVLQSLTVLIPQHLDLSPFPPVTRDFNFIVSDDVSWAQLESTVRDAGGELLESVEYRETFRDQERDGPNKKRLLLSVVLRSSDETLTGEQAEQVSKKIIDRCQRQFEAALVG